MGRGILFSLGIIYFWFGCLKFFPGLSPAEGLAGETIHLLTSGMCPQKVANSLLALLECGLGFCLIFNLFTYYVIRVMLLHLFCTFAPVVLMPEQVFVSAPFVLTLTGQYIIKNIVFISVGLFLIWKNRFESASPWSRPKQPSRLRKFASLLNGLF